MATKKSIKAKSKTSSKKSSAAKTAEKTIQTQTTATSEASGKSVNVLRLRSLHIMSLGIFVLLAVIAAIFMSNQSYQLTISYLTQDILDQTTLAPAIRALYDVELRWLVVALLVLSAVLPFLYLTKLEKRYINAVTNSRSVPWRWVDLAITGALMVETIALLSGIQDVMTLKLIGGLVAISFLLSWIVEWHYKMPYPARRTFAVAVASAVLPWLVIAHAAITTVVHGGAWAPWYVYALYAAAIAGIASLFCIQFTDYSRKRAAWQNYMIVERNYIAVNMLTKAAFALVLIIGLLK